MGSAGSTGSRARRRDPLHPRRRRALQRRIRRACGPVRGRGGQEGQLDRLSRRFRRAVRVPSRDVPGARGRRRAFRGGRGSGAAEVRVQPGKRPSVTYRDGRETEVRPRLVIGADGRTSTVRKQSGIQMNKIPATHVATGLLVEGAGKWPEDQYSIGVEGDCMFFVFPQGGGRLRLYICHANEQATRWAGRAARALHRGVRPAAGHPGVAGPEPGHAGGTVRDVRRGPDLVRRALRGRGCPRRRRGRLRQPGGRPGPVARAARRACAVRTAGVVSRLDDGGIAPVRRTARRTASPHAARLHHLRGVDDHLHRRLPGQARPAVRGGQERPG